MFAHVFDILACAPLLDEVALTQQNTLRDSREEDYPICQVTRRTTFDCSGLSHVAFRGTLCTNRFLISSKVTECFATPSFYLARSDYLLVGVPKTQLLYGPAPELASVELLFSISLISVLGQVSLGGVVSGPSAAVECSGRR